MLQAPIEAWISLFYLGLVSQFLAYVAWYGGMSLGSIARVGQMQKFTPRFNDWIFCIFLRRINDMVNDCFYRM